MIKKGVSCHMWSIGPIYQKNKGFTLLEIILFLGIGSIIMLPLLSILNFSLKSFDRGEQKDELFLNARYGIEYIKDEILRADKIIDSSKISGLKERYPENIGFVIVISEESGDYRYITYHISNSKLIRMACTRKDERYPSQISFAGYNVLSDYIESIDASNFYSKESMILLDFKFKHRNEKLNIKSDIYIRCPIEY